MKYRLKNWINFISQGNLQVFLVIFTSASLVILARLIAPIEIASDLGTNLEASHRLVRGLGLTVASGLDFDLNQAPHPEYLTQFPPGSSILMASLLVFKIPLAIALKIIYCFTTIIGWLGWGAIACRLLTKPIKFSSITLPINLIIAAILPLFYTPSWTIQGTDIFLWSGTPAIVFLLFYSSLKYSKNSLIIGAGLLFGLLISFRYVSYFLAFAALLILLQVNFPKFRLSCQKYLIFHAASLLFIIPIFIYVNLVKTKAEGQITNLMKGTETTLGFTDSLHENLKHFATTLIMSGSLTPQIIDNLEDSFVGFALKISWLLLILLLPFLVIKFKKINLDAIHRDISISIACLPISLVIFLSGLTFSLPWSPIGIERYYIPVNICLVLIFYEIATLVPISRGLKVIASVYIFSFLFYNFFYQSRFSALFRGHPKALVQDIVGFPLQKTIYPSNKIVIRDNESLIMLRKLKQKHPNALFFVQSYRAFRYDNPSRVIRIPDKTFWKQAYLSKDTKVFWIVSTKCQTICTVKAQEIPELSSIPNLKTIYTSPSNQTKIMVSDLPSGYKFFEQ